MSWEFVVFGLLGAGGGLALACFWAYRAGRKAQYADDSDNRDAAADMAMDVRDRLRRDADYARGVRERFSR